MDKWDEVLYVDFFFTLQNNHDIRKKCKLLNNDPDGIYALAENGLEKNKDVVLHVKLEKDVSGLEELNNETECDGVEEQSTQMDSSPISGRTRACAPVIQAPLRQAIGVEGLPVRKAIGNGKAKQENQRRNASDDPTMFMPKNDPDWDPNNSVGSAMIKQHQQLILYGEQHGVMNNLRLCETAGKWTDLNPEERTNQRMSNMLFIRHSALAIRKKLQKVDGGGGMSISQLTEIAYKVYNNWDETEKREKQKEN
ncbi:hypothetical protein QYF61_010460 [Mycteria americana]|uniref:Uncharacterized protein n=1 Tax=Mycteria americana TaxID=33587 RepID=A0AAN7N1J6_MYCAM|nr:hypothetical protein QYF61_010460 [Mycteria americana]